MKKYFLITAAVLISAAFFPAFRPGDEKEWVMKQYYFVLLSKGANRTQDSTTAAKLQAGHMANIEQMEKDGKLCLAGPFADNGDWRGLFILDVKTLEEAKALVDKDPAVQAGRLKYQIHPWWGGVGSKLK